MRELEELFKALAHPVRRHILLVLHFRGGTMTSREIAGRFACAWPTTTRHLGVLRKAGLVRVIRRGRLRAYALEAGRMEPVRAWMEWFRQPPLVEPPGEPDPWEI